MIRKKHRPFPYSTKLIVIAAIFLIIVCANLLAYQHAYAMLHFIQQGERTHNPEDLSFWQKMSVLLTGVNVPKPLNMATPAEYGLTYETHHLQVDDDVELEAWYLPKPESKGVVLLFHGYAASKSTVLPEAQALNALGYDTFLVDFRGSGGSNRSETSIGFYEADDVAASFEFVQQKLRRDNIILYGQSMGGVAILRAVAEKEVKPERIIVEAVFDRMVSTVANRFSTMGLLTFPSAQLLIFWGSVINGYSGFEHNPVRYAAEIDCPTLILHGTADDRATLEQVQVVYEQIRSEKRFEVFDGVGHESYLAANSERWQEIVREFLSQ